MAKKPSDTTYTTVNFTNPKVKAALAAVTKAEEDFQKIALEIAGSAKLIPAGQYGKIVRNRFGGGWQLALRPTPWPEGDASGVVTI